MAFQISSVITLPNFPLSMKVYNSNKKYTKSVFPKIVLCEMMMAITPPLEVDKFSSWHFSVQLTGNISLEITDTNPIIFHVFICTHSL